MLSDVACRSLAEQYLARIAEQCGENLVLLPTECGTARTLVYSYQTVEYVATGDFTYALAGNGPILVSTLTGEVELAGTALPPEIYVRDFEVRTGTSA